MGESAARAIKFVGRIQKEREEGAEQECFYLYLGSKVDICPPCWALLPERLQRPPSIRSTNKFRPQFKAIKGR
jgi:hypothetical protein